MIPMHTSMKEQLIITFENELNAEMFEGNDIALFCRTNGNCLGTSLQNRDLLKFFHQSTWGVIGLEMEVLITKTIQSASKLEKSTSGH
jgi:hypothetical protein